MGQHIIDGTNADTQKLSITKVTEHSKSIKHSIHFICYLTLLHCCWPSCLLSGSWRSTWSLLPQYGHEEAVPHPSPSSWGDVKPWARALLRREECSGSSGRSPPGSDRPPGERVSQKESQMMSRVATAGQGVIKSVAGWKSSCVTDGVVKGNKEEDDYAVWSIRQRLNNLCKS